MINLHWYNEEMTADKAVKGYDYVALYDEDNNEVNRIINIYGSEWSHISIDGEWSSPEDIPTEEEFLRADIDFLTMENEALEEQIEIDRADIDFLLMLLDDTDEEEELDLSEAEPEFDEEINE